jgi:hemerythrin-like domain-containing protein
VHAGVVQLIDDLRAEHDLIDAVADSFRAFAAQVPLDRDDARAYLRFFRLFAGQYHHAREEDTLFTALVERASLPGDRGPVAVLTDEHHRMAAMLDGIEQLLAREVLDRADLTALEQRVREYTEALHHHIDAENSVLLPESEGRLRKNGVLELPGRPPAGDEREAKEAGMALLARYTPRHDPAVVRGDGCVLCPAMGAACQGLEFEWWSESEWDELEDHLPAG